MNLQSYNYLLIHLLWGLPYLFFIYFFVCFSSSILLWLVLQMVRCLLKTQQKDTNKDGIRFFCGGLGCVRYTLPSSWTRVCVCVYTCGCEYCVSVCVCACTYVSACSHPHAYFPLLGKNPWFNELFIIHILLKKKINAGGNMVVWYFHEGNSLHTSPLKKQEARVWTHQQFECRPPWCSNILTDANHYDWSCLLLSFQFMTE